MAFGKTNSRLLKLLSLNNFFKPHYPAVKEKEVVNYNFLQRKRKQTDLYREANEIINTLANFNYQFTIPLNLPLFIPLFLLHPHQGTYLFSGFVIILKSSIPPLKT